VLRELFGSERVFPIGRLAFTRYYVAGWLAVVVTVHDELAFDGDGLVIRVVKVDASPESARRLFSRRV
jgi:hypothetical protein